MSDWNAGGQALTSSSPSLYTIPSARRVSESESEMMKSEAACSYTAERRERERERERDERV